MLASSSSSFTYICRIMESISYGAIAAVLTTTAFLPQAFKVIRTGEAKSLSLSMFLMMFVGTLLWALHGFDLEDKPMIYANLTTSGLNAVILVIKIRSIIREKQVNS
jgi:MtN3 and saliva related transmembrane protein